MADQPPHDDGAAAPTDSQEAAFQALHAERGLLERALTLAQQQQQFGANPAEIEGARLREEALLKDLDRVMTLIRAAEVRRKSGAAARRWQ